MCKATSFLVVLVAASALPVPRTQAQMFTVLYKFSGGTDGIQPFAGLVMDKDGNLYGTTASGGVHGLGTVFNLDTTGTETVLHSFGGVDGAVPLAGLAMDKDGNLYGTTAFGGSSFVGSPNSGFGSVFKVDTSSNETVLHSFTNLPDGAEPVAGLVMDKEGNLYGTTVVGGSGGTVFEVDKNGTETVLHSFPGVDGNGPEASLTIDKEGNVYGTTVAGGAFTMGTVFKLNIAGTKTILHSFSGADGAFPRAGLVRDKSGNLYGTTSEGGSSALCFFGCGVIFKVDGDGRETVLHSFSGADGWDPEAVLVIDKDGNLYGTTAFGGASFVVNLFNGYGTVFKLDTSGNETVLHSFSGEDGESPLAGLIMDKAGNLYGTAAFGGSSFHGTVFKLNPQLPAERKSQ